MSATVSAQGKGTRISQTRIDGATIVRPVGALDAGLADDLREVSLEAHGPVVVDLAEAVLVDAAATGRIVTGWQLYRPPMCIVCHRPTTRSLLRRAGIHEHVALFKTVDEALAADGWRPRRST